MPTNTTNVRTLTVKVQVQSDVVGSSPSFITFNGLDAFIYGGVSWPQITREDLRNLTHNNNNNGTFDARKNAFVSYVNEQTNGQIVSTNWQDWLISTIENVVGSESHIKISVVDDGGNAKILISYNEPYLLDESQTDKVIGLCNHASITPTIADRYVDGPFDYTKTELFTQIPYSQVMNYRVYFIIDGITYYTHMVSTT